MLCSLAIETCLYATFCAARGRATGESRVSGLSLAVSTRPGHRGCRARHACTNRLRTALASVHSTTVGMNPAGTASFSGLASSYEERARHIEQSAIKVSVNGTAFTNSG